MVMDFYDMKSILKQVLSEYDHRPLNDIIEYPSVENICESVYSKLQGKITLPFMIRMLGRAGQVVRAGRPIDF